MQLSQGIINGRHFFRIDCREHTLFVSRVTMIPTEEMRRLTLNFLMQHDGA